MDAESTGEGVPVPFDFWHCAKCGRLCTKLELARALGLAPTKSACPCGALKFAPINLRWYQWILPRVWVFAGYRVLGWA